MHIGDAGGSPPTRTLLLDQPPDQSSARMIYAPAVDCVRLRPVPFRLKKCTQPCKSRERSISRSKPAFHSVRRESSK